LRRTRTEVAKLPPEFKALLELGFSFAFTKDEMFWRQDKNELQRYVYREVVNNATEGNLPDKYADRLLNRFEKYLGHEHPDGRATIAKYCRRMETEIQRELGGYEDR
jgi:hypothetical protein